MDKIRVAFCYKPSYQFLTGRHFDNNLYYFFMHALKRNTRIDVEYFQTEKKIDSIKLKNNFDIILLPDSAGIATPEITGIDSLDIPVIAYSGDQHYAEKFNPVEIHKKFKINYYFSSVHESYFYKFLPNYFKYKTIFPGLEKTVYENIKNFKDRIKDKILNSGAIGKRNFKSRLVNSVLNPKSSGWYFYKLRTMCNELPYIAYQGAQNGKYPNQNYVEYLSEYRAAIAATTHFASLKYLEVPAAGCLTFMEVTDHNKAEFLGFEDHKTAIFINEKNYKDRFEEYVENLENPEWETIAKNGREYSLKTFDNNKSVEKLVALMESLI